MGRRYRRTTYHRYTPPVRAVPAKTGYTTKSGRYIPATPAIPGSPGTSLTTTEYQQPSTPVDISGNPQVVMVLLIVLFIVVTWQDLGSSIILMIWDPSSKNNITTLNWGKYIGMIVFIVLATGIALTGDDAAGVVLMVTIGVWVVYLIENNGGNVTPLFDWLNSMSVNSKPQSL